MNKVIITLFSILISSASFAQETGFSLEKAINYGFQNNNSFINTKIDEEIQTEFTKENTSIGMPQIKAKFDYNYAYKQAISIIPAGTFGPNEVEATFNQPHTATASIEASQLVFDTRYFFRFKSY